MFRTFRWGWRLRRGKRASRESSLNVPQVTVKKTEMCPGKLKSAAGSSWTVALLILACFGFCSSAVSGLAEAKSGWEELFVNDRAARFVAVNGSDSGPGT